jgi:HSP20 family protein
MPRRKKSFFERLTGSVNTSTDEYQDPRQQSYDESFPEDEFSEPSDDHRQQPQGDWDDPQYEAAGSFEDEGELAVDVYETAEHVIVQAMVAGVRPDALDVSITRENCTISGRREAPNEAGPDEYVHQELYWGSFSRSIILPEEVEVEEADANENHGLLTIKLPKINKDRETKLEISSE